MTDPLDKSVALNPIEVQKGPVSEIPCFICGKQKGQPPERCNGHYAGTGDPYLIGIDRADGPDKSVESIFIKCPPGTIPKFDEWIITPDGTKIYAVRVVEEEK